MKYLLSAIIFIMIGSLARLTGGEIDGNSTGIYAVTKFGNVPERLRRKGGAKDWDKVRYPTRSFLIKPIGLKAFEKPNYAKRYTRWIADMKKQGIEVIIRTDNRYSWKSRPTPKDTEMVKKGLVNFFKYVNPDDIYGISLGEENVAPPKFEAILNELYDFIKSKWPNLKVFQWYSTPIVAGCEAAVLKADGWIIDNYSMPNPRFRRTLMHYVVMGKPVLSGTEACNGTGLFSSKSRPAINNQYLKVWNNQYWNVWYTQLFTCREFDVPVWFFNLDTTVMKHATMGKDPFHQQIMYAISRYDKWLQTLPPGAFATADYSNAENMIEIVGDKQGKFKYEDDFKFSHFIDDAAIEGFMDFVWEPGKLKTRGYRKRNVHCSLTYELKSFFKLKNAKITLSGTAGKAVNGKIILSASKDGINYIKTAEITPGKEQCSVILDAKDKLDTKLWVRLEFRGNPGSIQAPATVLKKLSIHVNHEVPPDKIVHLSPPISSHGRRRGHYPIVEYFDDYKISGRYKFHTDVKLSDSAIFEQIKKSYCGITVKAPDRKRKRVTLDLIYHFVSKYPLNNIRLAVDGRCSSYGSDFSLAVSKDGKTWTNEVSGRKTLRIPPPFRSRQLRGTIEVALDNNKEYRNIKDFYVRIRLVNVSNKRYVWLRDFRLVAKTETAPPKK